MKRESKADQQTIRDEADATAREAERQANAATEDHQWQADRELERALNRAEGERAKPKLPLWQRFLAWLDRVA